MTDVVINSQTQSPAVRVLASVDSAAGNFTHHVADNVPPVSFTEVELSPSTTWAGQAGSVRIELPQLGYLEKVEAIFRWKSSAASAAANLTPLVPLVYELFESASLQTRRKDLARCYSRHMRNKDLRCSVAEARHLHRSSEFYTRSPSDGAWGNYVRDTTGVGAGLMAAAVADGLAPTGIDYEARVELDFAVLKLPAIQLQTLFVETMEVEIQAYQMIGNASSSPFRVLPNNQSERTAGTPADISDYELVLRCRYRNFHDETENVIRNENYVSGTPATILSASVFPEAAKAIAPPTDLDRNTVVTSTSVATRNVLRGQTDTIKTSTQITSKNLAYGISFGLGTERGGARSFRNGWRLVVARLKASGRTLMEWSEQDLRQHMRQSYLKTSNPYGQKDISGWSTVQSFNASAAPNTYPDYPQFYTIQFGMQYGEAFNTGALGLSALSSVVLECEWVLDYQAMTAEDVDTNAGTTALLTGRGDVWDHFQCYVYVEHFQLLRIDPDNGAITTSLDI